MTTIVFRIVLFILAIWIVWQLLSTFLVKNRNASSKKQSTSGGNMVKDPICGMYMDPRLAVKYETKTGVFYFCSTECKKKFLQAHSSEKPGNASSGE